VVVKGGREESWSCRCSRDDLVFIRASYPPPVDLVVGRWVFRRGVGGRNVG